MPDSCQYVRKNMKLLPSGAAFCANKPNAQQHFHPLRNISFAKVLEIAVSTTCSLGSHLLQWARGGFSDLALEVYAGELIRSARTRPKLFT
eukprot:4698459-Amphidinium_carterae.1